MYNVPRYRSPPFGSYLPMLNPLLPSFLVFSSNKTIHRLFPRRFYTSAQMTGRASFIRGGGEPREAKKFIHQGRTSPPSGRLCDHKDRGKLVVRAIWPTSKGASDSFLCDPQLSPGLYSRLYYYSKNFFTRKRETGLSFSALPKDLILSGERHLISTLHDSRYISIDGIFDKKGSICRAPVRKTRETRLRLRRRRAISHRREPRAFNDFEK